MNVAIRAERIQSLCAYFYDRVLDEAFVAIRHTSHYFNE